MPFTDDDMKQLKESLNTYQDDQSQCYRVMEFKALVARLEAAEACISDTEDDKCSIFDCWHERTYKAWRAAAGKA